MGSRSSIYGCCILQTSMNEDPSGEGSPIKRPNPWRWVWRLAAIATFFYILGYFSHPIATPLMCKIYG